MKTEFPVLDTEIPPPSDAEKKPFAAAVSCRRIFDYTERFQKAVLVHLLHRALVITQHLRKDKSARLKFAKRIRSEAPEGYTGKITHLRSDIHEAVGDFIFEGKSYDRAYKMKAIVEFYAIINFDPDAFIEHLTNNGIEKTYEDVCRAFPKKGRTKAQIAQDRLFLEAGEDILNDDHSEHPSDGDGVEREGEREKNLRNENRGFELSPTDDEEETAPIKRKRDDRGRSSSLLPNPKRNEIGPILEIEASQNQIEDIKRYPEGENIRLVIKNAGIEDDYFIRLILLEVQ